MKAAFKFLQLLLAAQLAAVLAGCASTIQTSSLAKPKNPSDTIQVSAFTYGKGQIGLDAGLYKVEYESADGSFYRGPGLAVQVPPAINTNKEKYPDSKFPGGLFVPRHKGDRGYRVYYYQLNIAGSPGPQPDWQTAMVVQHTVASPTPVASAVGAAIGLGIVDYMIESGRGQIVLIPGTDEVDIASHTSKP